VPLAKVVLTGILNVLGPPRALFEVMENEPGKQPNTKKPILREGEREGSIEVISIDIAKSIVRIKNGNVETNVTFETLKQSGGGPTLTASGAAAPPPALNLPPPAPAMNTSAIVPTGSPNSRPGRSIVVAGAEPVASSSLAGSSSMLAMGNASAAYGNGNGNSFQMPSRQIRGTQNQPQQQPVTDPAQQWIHMKALEEAAGKQNVPFPPTPPVPGMDPTGTPAPGNPGTGTPPPRSGRPPPPMPPGFPMPPGPQ